MSNGCTAFCLLASTIAFFISWMMGSTNLATFKIPAIEQKWDLQLKAAACRHAGFAYLFIALLLVATGFYKNQQSRETRVAGYGTEASVNEKAELLGGVKRRRAPADYGSAVELRKVQDDDDER